MKTWSWREFQQWGIKWSWFSYYWSWRGKQWIVIQNRTRRYYTILTIFLPLTLSINFFESQINFTLSQELLAIINKEIWIISYWSFNLIYFLTPILLFFWKTIFKIESCSFFMKNSKFKVSFFYKYAFSFYSCANCWVSSHWQFNHDIFFSKHFILH